MGDSTHVMKTDDSKKATLGRVTLSLARAITGVGLDADHLFSQVGLDLRTIQSDHQHIPQKSITRLIDIISNTLSDPTLGLYIAQCTHPLRYGPLSSALYASRNLREYFCLRRKYASLVSTFWHSELTETGDQAKVMLKLQPGVSHQPVLTDWWAAALLTDMQQVYRPDLYPVRVDVSRPEPREHKDRYLAVFGVKPQFDTPESALYFDRSVLDEELPGGDAQFLTKMESILADLVIEVDRSDVVALVRAQILHLLPSEDIRIELVAGKLGVSVRMLYIRLKQNNTSFQKVFDDTRAELSKRYIQQNRLSIKEVAYQVGYSDYSNFSRSFKRWTGLTPSEYRRTTNP